MLAMATDAVWPAGGDWSLESPPKSFGDLHHMISSSEAPQLRRIANQIAIAFMKGPQEISLKAYIRYHINMETVPCILT
jgi:hypothetical protein